jgi:hypothetical protein
MAAALINYEERLRQAVRFFWRGRRDAAKKQQATGKLDQGNRGAVTGGKNLNAFRDMIVDVVNRHGPEGCEVHRGKTMVVLPGFFRPTKQWDLLIVIQKRLLAAFELNPSAARRSGTMPTTDARKPWAADTISEKPKAKASSVVGHHRSLATSSLSRILPVPENPSVPNPRTFQQTKSFTPPPTSSG